MRKLVEHGPVRLDRLHRVDPDALNRFFAVEQSGWKGRSGTAIACNPATRRFYTEVATAADHHGYLAHYELWCGNQPVAISLGMDLAGRFFKLKSAIDESFKAVGPGHLMNGEILRDLVDRESSEFDMLGHNDWFKARWAPIYRQHYHCHVFGKGTIGRALQTWTERFVPAGRRIHRRLRRLDGGDRDQEFGAHRVNGRETT